MAIIERLDPDAATSERSRVSARVREAVGTDDRAALRARVIDGSLTDSEAEDVARLDTLDYLLDERR